MPLKSNARYLSVDFIAREWHPKKLNDLVTWETVILKVTYNLKLVLLLSLFFYVSEPGKTVFNPTISELTFNRSTLGILSNTCLFLTSNNKGRSKAISHEACKAASLTRRFKQVIALLVFLLQFHQILITKKAGSGSGWIL